MSCATTQPQTTATADVQVLTPTEYKAQQPTRKDVLLDVRTPEEYATGHLENARNVDYRGGAFAEEMKNWDKNKVYYLYCASGNRSGKAAELLKEAGFKHIYNIGGFPALQEANLPVEKETQQ
ncbi:rhodanese-like domain-containing protein [Pontibacter sp. 172403-2]|nr:rhodanese-like domain-containing protein [Pontibacter sp. 172403-2]